MTRGLVLAADGVDETQLDYAYHRLREDAVLVDVAAPDGGSVTTSSGHSRAVSAIEDLPSARRYDLVVVPSGSRVANLTGDGAVRRFVRAHHDADGVLCAIGDGVGLLAAFGLLNGRLTTGPDARRDDLVAAGAEPTGEAVTVDGTVVTARGTDALPFAIAAALGSVAIPQDRAVAARERPHWGPSDPSERPP